MEERGKCVAPAYEKTQAGSINSSPRARRALISRRWAIMISFLVIIAAAAPQALAKQIRPGMRFIAKTSAQAPILEEILEGKIPPTIPQYLTLPDPTGKISSYQSGGATKTAGNGFFSTAITTNRRTCFTCHQPQNGWEISPPQIRTEFITTRGKSVLFHPVDAADCPDLPGATARFPDPRFVRARSQLFTRGNFRISLNGPNPLGPKDSSYTTFSGNTTPEWVLTVDYDPYGCETNHVYGLYANQVSVYRRPLPSANVAFLNRDAAENKLDIMWDARELDLNSQFIDATMFHGQTSVPPDENSIKQGVLFQSGMFTGQSHDHRAGDLTGGDGSLVEGGPVNLYLLRQGSTTPCFDVSSGELAGELVCPGIKVKEALAINLPAPLQFVNASGTLVTTLKSNVASQLYGPFATSATGNAMKDAQRESIASGEALFSTNPFAINNVPGLNDIKGDPTGVEAGTCSTCHSNLNAPNDTASDPKRLGIMDNSTGVNVMPATPDFPRFAFYCKTGSIPYFSNPVSSPNCPGGITPCDEFITTDPGKGLITGLCKDLGKMKVPVLRGLASRAPYFHGGNAATLEDVVNFYDNRFNIGLTAQQKQDLVNFLNSL